MSPNVLPWVVYPYLAALVFVCGHVWRWKKDQFTITTKSSQPLERKWLMRGSVPFHLGMLGVMGGHVVGLLLPAGLTARFGVSEHVYHLQAVVLGGAMGIVCWTGILILTCRRLLIKAVRRAGTLADIVTELMLLVVITLGNCQTLGYQLFVHEYNYRETVSVWIRQLPLFDPDPSIMGEIPWIYQAHILAAFTLLAFWPFSRLVHVWTAPVQYIRRAQILSRGSRQAPALVSDGPRSLTWCDVVARHVSRTWRLTSSTSAEAAAAESGTLSESGGRFTFNRRPSSACAARSRGHAPGRSRTMRRADQEHEGKPLDLPLGRVS